MIMNPAIITKDLKLCNALLQILPRKYVGTNLPLLFKIKD